MENILNNIGFTISDLKFLGIVLLILIFLTFLLLRSRAKQDDLPISYPIYLSVIFTLFLIFVYGTNSDIQTIANKSLFLAASILALFLVGLQSFFSKKTEKKIDEIYEVLLDRKKSKTFEEKKADFENEIYLKTRLATHYKLQLIYQSIAKDQEKLKELEKKQKNKS